MTTIQMNNAIIELQNALGRLQEQVKSQEVEIKQLKRSTLCCTPSGIKCRTHHKSYDGEAWFDATMRDNRIRREQLAKQGKNATQVMPIEEYAKFTEQDRELKKLFDEEEKKEKKKENKKVEKPKRKRVVVVEEKKEEKEEQRILDFLRERVDKTKIPPMKLSPLKRKKSSGNWGSLVDHHSNPSVFPVSPPTTCLSILDNGYDSDDSFLHQEIPVVAPLYSPDMMPMPSNEQISKLCETLFGSDDEDEVEPAVVVEEQKVEPAVVVEEQKVEPAVVVEEPAVVVEEQKVEPAVVVEEQKVEPDEDSYNSLILLSVKNLKQLCKDRKYKGSSKHTTKQALISFILEKESKTEVCQVVEPVVPSLSEINKENLYKMSVSELQTFCRANKMKGFSKCRKKEEYIKFIVERI